MNDRIRELVRQAGLDDANFPIENWDNVPLAKFAELIVKECASLFPLAFTDEQYPRRIDKTIRKHFGIEE